MELRHAVELLADKTRDGNSQFLQQVKAAG
jgi:hypothetical protein